MRESRVSKGEGGENVGRGSGRGVFLGVTLKNRGGWGEGRNRGDGKSVGYGAVHGPSLLCPAN